MTARYWLWTGPGKSLGPMSWEVERLISAMAKTPHRTASTQIGGIPVTGTWQIDLSIPRCGSWLVRVGPVHFRARDLSEVHRGVLDRLSGLHDRAMRVLR